MAVGLMDSRAFSLSLILMARLPSTQHSPNAAQSRRFSLTLPPSATVLFLLYFSLNCEDACVFNTAFGV